MVLKVFGYFIIVLSFDLCNGDRRIVNGTVVTSEKRYVVYLVKASVSPKKYDTWLCGGALVTQVFIVTSAACIEDVQHLYAIAGYDKYVSDKDIHSDTCTKNKKKKIIYSCTPAAYTLDYKAIDKWSYIDIAVVRVESPYDLRDDESYKAAGCSYAPVPIKINYNEKYQSPGIDAMVLGWGHGQKWRQPGDNTNYNKKELHYAPVVLLEKSVCIRAYSNYTNMDKVINKYMICSMGKGNINENGETIVHVKEEDLPVEGCAMELRIGPNGECVEDQRTKNLRDDDEDYTEYTLEDSEKDSLFKYVAATNKSKLMIDDIKFSLKNVNRKRFRRNGICQNDHGGPIVTWRGAHEILIGVNSVFKVTPGSSCVGPYLYTSTQCNGLFLNCILTSEHDKTRRSSLCDGPPILRGFKMVERTISWRNHPDGPADNERLPHE